MPPPASRTAPMPSGPPRLAPVHRRRRGRCWCRCWCSPSLPRPRVGPVGLTSGLHRDASGARDADIELCPPGHGLVRAIDLERGRRGALQVVQRHGHRAVAPGRERGVGCTSPSAGPSLLCYLRAASTFLLLFEVSLLLNLPWHSASRNPVERVREVLSSGELVTPFLVSRRPSEGRSLIAPPDLTWPESGEVPPVCSTVFRLPG